MAPLPIINDVFRVTYEFSPFEGVSPRIVQHFLSNTGDEADLAAALDAQSLNDQWYPMSLSQTLDSYSIIKLDGSSPTHVIASTSGAHGRGNSSIIPSTAMILSMHTGLRGRSGRGRNYIGPVTEDQTASGLISGTAAGNAAAAWATFQSGMETEGAGYTLGVASYHLAEFNAVVNLSCKSLAVTQRRRQDQLR